MRQLLNMCNAKNMIAWDHTAALCATVINMHRDPKRSKPAEAAKLNPYRKGGVKKDRPKIRLNKADSMKLLKRVFIDHQGVNPEKIMQGKIED